MLMAIPKTDFVFKIAHANCRNNQSFLRMAAIPKNEDSKD